MHCCGTYFTHARTCGNIRVHTWSRGQLWTQNPLKKPSLNPDPPTSRSHSQPTDHVPRGRLQCFTWNSGALSSQKYRELLHWLFLSKIDIAIIIETHWKLDEEWSTEHFHALHSGNRTPDTYDSSAGILILVSGRLCETSQISWVSHHSGRLVHCRLHCQPRNIDIVGIYQYVWNGNALQTQRRQHLCELTQKTLDALARRNTLCMMGDFHWSIGAIPRLAGTNPFVGSSGNKLRGPQHGDSDHLQRLIQELKLVGLNTWEPNRGPTFTNPLGCSRSDFIFTRMIQAVGVAKKVGYLTHAPFLQGGSTHIISLCWPALDIEYRGPTVLIPFSITRSNRNVSLTIVMYCQMARMHE